MFQKKGGGIWKRLINEFTSIVIPIHRQYYREDLVGAGRLYQSGGGKGNICNTFNCKDKFKKCKWDYKFEITL